MSEALGKGGSSRRLIPIGYGAFLEPGWNLDAFKAMTPYSDILYICDVSFYLSILDLRQSC